MVRPEGFEPPAYRFEACRSIQLSYGRALEVGTFYRAPGFRRAVSIRDGWGEQAHPYARITFCLGAISARRSPHSPFGPVAQLAEQQTLNLRVVGSIPTRLTTLSSALSNGAKYLKKWCRYGTL